MTKIAIVTGASSGIGEATAELLARSGYTVYGTSRRGAAGAGAAQAARPFEMLALDVTSEDSVAALVAEVLRRHGRIDLLVNNAGFGVAPAAAQESSIAQGQAIFDTNFFGIVRMTRAVVPQMRRQGAGRILNISSVLGFVSMPYAALYCATKHAVEGYSESLDQELRTLGVRVSLIEPAYVNTPFEGNQLQPDAPLAEYREARATIALRVKEAMEGADRPDVVARTVLKAAQDKRPKVRYTAGAMASRLRALRRFAPASLVEAGIRKDMRLDAQPPVGPVANLAEQA